MMTKRVSNHSVLWYCVLCLVVFCYTYQFDLSIFGLPSSIHSIRFATFLLILLTFIKELTKRTGRFVKPSGYVRKSLKNIVVFHVFLLFYMVFLLLSIGRGTGSHMADAILNMFLFTFIPILAFLQVFETLKEFMKVVLIVTIIQAVIIWMCILNPSFGAYIDIIFNQGEYFEKSRESYAGGLGCITAPGVIKFSIGIIACVYFIIFTGKPLYIILYFLLSFTGSMVARTGLLISITGLVFIIFYFVSSKRKSIYLKLFVVLLILAGIFIHTLNSNKYDNFIETRFARMINLFENGPKETFLDNYFHGETTVVPPVTYETIVGTGIQSGMSENGIKVNVDGGFMRLYVAYGLPLSILFYCFMFYNFLKVSLKSVTKPVKYLLLLTCAIILIGEFKEFTLYSSCLVSFFYVSASLAYSEMNRKLYPY